MILPTRDLKGIQEETLLDGELVWDNAKGELVYYIFDAIMFMARTLIGLDLPGRLQIVQNDIITPHEKRMSSTGEKYPFKIKLKQMWKPYGLRDLFERVIPGQGHENDGLIFTPVKDGYFAGTCHRLLKWKPSDMNTIDFLIVCIVDGRIFDFNDNTNSNINLSNDTIKVELHIATQGRSHFYMNFDILKDEELSKLSPAEYCGKIGEFRYISGSKDCDSTAGFDDSKDRWGFMRFRPDKRLPNDSKTVEKVLHSIKDNVTKEDLLKREVVIRSNWKKREASVAVPSSGLKSAPSNAYNNTVKNGTSSSTFSNASKNPYITANTKTNDNSSKSDDIDLIVPRSQQEKSSPFKYPLSLSDSSMRDFSWTSTPSQSRAESESDQEETAGINEKEVQSSSINYRTSISLDYDLNDEDEDNNISISKSSKKPKTEK